MKKIFLICIAVILAVPSVCFAMDAAGQQEMSMTAERDLANRLVSQDLNAFVTFSRMNFEDRIDDDFLPNKELFLNIIEDAFLKERPQELTFTLNEVVSNDGKLAASIHWMKKVVDPSGNAILKEGNADMIYIQRGSDWLIYQVQGDSPFIS